jgi:hypothetical protein
MGEKSMDSEQMTSVRKTSDPWLLAMVGFYKP